MWSELLVYPKYLGKFATESRLYTIVFKTADFSIICCRGANDFMWSHSGVLKYQKKNQLTFLHECKTKLWE